MPVYDEKQIKTKVREINGVIKTNFLGDEIPKESMRYTSIACRTIDSFMRMEKKSYPQVYLEECKYKSKKIKMTKFINTELESDLESDTELESKLEPDSEKQFFYSLLLYFKQINYFEQVKKLIVILLTLGKSKN